jgi:radical SAM superfamily enzyme YgiQ (UPF0313 family)
MPTVRSVLYVFLPCRPVYPAGPVVLANAVHQQDPRIRQHILDLSLIPHRDRPDALLAKIRDLGPQLVCFSWRDIQVFAPHEGDPSLKYAFNFYYSSNPIKKIAASARGLQYLWTYYRGIRENLSFPRLVRKHFPNTGMMIGGGAFSVFSDQLVHRLPEGVIGILGEGETALLKYLQGRSLEDERSIWRKGSRIFRGEKAGFTATGDQSIDVDYVSAIFPQYLSYARECIGVQTKRGCPYDCQFCEYPYIEGKKVRYRSPERVVDEIRQYHTQWGSRSFWFTDAQFITGSEALPQCVEILERLISGELAISWSGYVRTSLITPGLARLMVQSGVGDLEVAVTSGSQEILNDLHMGFRLDKLYDGCRYLKEAGYTGRLILNYSLNAPGETEATLLQSVESYKKIAEILGEDRVFPMLFFLGIQPHTGLERRLLEDGYLYDGYDPLSINPRTIKKMIHNPPPFSRLIARACLKAWDRTSWEKDSPSGRSVRDLYADEALFRSVAENSGREVLLDLEQQLRSKQLS